MTKKVVFITGSADGIGKLMGENFLKEGYSVVFSDVNEPKLNELVDKLTSQGHDAFGVVCDVTSEEAINVAVDKVIEKYGRLDVLVNNAGFQFVANIEDFPVQRAQLMMDLMIMGPFIATKKVFPIMKEQKFGRIINMGSIMGVIGMAGKSGYNAAKHGVIGLTKATALEGAPFGITVNAVCPGYVDTALVANQLQGLADTRNVPVEKVKEEVLYPDIPQKRLLEVQEIVDYALFLASDKAKGINGQACLIDAGYTAR